MKVASEREVQDILPRLAHFKLQAKGGTAIVKEGRVAVDPGTHRIQATGRSPSGQTLRYESRVEIKEGGDETLTIDLR